MTRISKYENVPIRNYQDAQKYLVPGSIIMGTEYRVAYDVEIVKHANGRDLYGYYEDGIGQALMLDGTPYKLPRGLTEEYVTLYTPQEEQDD